MRKIKKVISLLIAPRSSIEEMRRQEHILNVILLGSILFLFITSALSGVYMIIFSMRWPEKTYPGNSPITILAILVVFLFLFFLSKRGRYKLSAGLIIGFYLLPTFQSLYRWSISMPTGLLTLALVIILSGILLGRRYASTVTSVILLTLIAFYFLQAAGLHTPDLSWGSESVRFGNLIVFLIILSLIFLVSWLYNREMEASFSRARKSEAALKQERDLLEIKVAERTRELRKTQQEKITQLFQFAKFGQIAGGILHDLINPLTAISLNLEKLNETNFSKLGDTKQHLAQALLAARKAEEFISVARKQMQQREEKTYFSANEEIDQVVEIMSYKAKNSRVEIGLDLSGGSRIYGSATKFHQAITNVVSNAIEAYEDVKNPRKLIKIKSYRNSNKLCLTIQDWGKGIPPKDLKQIFDPLFTTKTSGTGMGLTVVKDIIEESFGGKIEIESMIGQGTVFSIKFPLSSMGDTADVQ